MKPGCILHPFLTGVVLWSSKKTLWIGKIKPLKDEVEDLMKAGIQHIELNSDIIQFTPVFRKKFRAKEMSYLEGLRKRGLLTISVHIDHIGFSFPSRFRRMRDGTIAHFRYLTEIYYRRLNPTHYTLHIGPDEMFRAPVFKNLPSIKILPLKKINIAKKIKNITIEEILRIAPRAFEGLDTAGVDLSKICVENMEGMKREEFDELFKEISKMVPEIGCTLDVGHLLMEEYSKNERCLEDFVKYWGKKKKKIRAVHIHDVVMSFNNKKLVAEAIERLKKEGRGKDDLILQKLEEFMKSNSRKKPVFADHQNLGTGILNLPRFLKILKEANFEGPIIFEGGGQKGFLDSARLLVEEIKKIKEERK